MQSTIKGFGLWRWVRLDSSLVTQWESLRTGSFLVINAMLKLCKLSLGPYLLLVMLFGWIDELCIVHAFEVSIIIQNTT